MDSTALKNLTRSQLQGIAKREKIKANGKSVDIIRLLIEKYPEGVPHPASTEHRSKRSSAEGSSRRPVRGGRKKSTSVLPSEAVPQNEESKRTSPTIDEESASQAPATSRQAEGSPQRLQASHTPEAHDHPEEASPQDQDAPHQAEEAPDQRDGIARTTNASTSNVDVDNSNADVHISNAELNPDNAATPPHTVPFGNIAIDLSRERPQYADNEDDANVVNEDEYMDEGLSPRPRTRSPPQSSPRLQTRSLSRPQSRSPPRPQTRRTPTPTQEDTAEPENIAGPSTDRLDSSTPVPRGPTVQENDNILRRLTRLANAGPAREARLATHTTVLNSTIASMSESRRTLQEIVLVRQLVEAQLQSAKEDHTLLDGTRNMQEPFRTRWEDFMDGRERRRAERNEEKRRVEEEMEAQRLARQQAEDRRIMIEAGIDPDELSDETSEDSEEREDENEEAARVRQRQLDEEMEDMYANEGEYEVVRDEAESDGSER
ncbi:hypothetical protein PLICRDRAFT_34622 [Plicaturopsis crispa FD-325 SS-3]|nr:hypothetical protein PLICRDRAFT_34622 [Plicaturopsis crispa FD-325 SS-3]